MKFAHTKFGLKHDPRGAHVTMEYQGRTLIGEVTGAHRNDVRGCILLSVRHFNGEPWPMEPGSYSVSVLERRAAEGGAA